MFTGIIKKTPKVLFAEKRGKSRIVHIEKPRGMKFMLGESVSINGVCSTVRAQGATYLEFEYMPATLNTTTAGSLVQGDVVNFERSLRMIEAVDGHFVQGHIDARGKIVRVHDVGPARTLTIQVPLSALRLIAPKGSVAVHGVSLTVQAKQKRTFSISLVSYSRKHTNLGQLRRGDYVNIETDMIARYLAELRGK